MLSGTEATKINWRFLMKVQEWHFVFTTKAKVLRNEQKKKRKEEKFVINEYRFHELSLLFWYICTCKCYSNKTLIHFTIPKKKWWIISCLNWICFNHWIQLPLDHNTNLMRTMSNLLIFSWTFFFCLRSEIIWKS